MSEFPISDQLDRGQPSFSQVIGETPVPFEPFQSSERNTQRLPLMDRYGLFTNFSFRAGMRSHNHTSEGSDAGLLPIEPSIQMTLFMGTSSNQGIAAEIEYARIPVGTGVVHGGRLLMDLVGNYLEPTRFSIFNIIQPDPLNSSVAEKTFPLGSGEVGTVDEEELSVGQNVSRVLRVGIDSLVSLGSIHLDLSLHAAQPPRTI